MAKNDLVHPILTFYYQCILGLHGRHFGIAGYCGRNTLAKDNFLCEHIGNYIKSSVLLGLTTIGGTYIDIIWTGSCVSEWMRRRARAWAVKLWLHHHRGRWAVPRLRDNIRCSACSAAREREGREAAALTKSVATQRVVIKIKTLASCKHTCKCWNGGDSARNWRCPGRILVDCLEILLTNKSDWQKPHNLESVKHVTPAFPTQVRAPPITTLTVTTKTLRLSRRKNYSKADNDERRLSPKTNPIQSSCQINHQTNVYCGLVSRSQPHSKRTLFNCGLMLHASHSSRDTSSPVTASHGESKLYSANHTMSESHRADKRQVKARDDAATRQVD